MFLFIDFETRSTVDLRKTGVYVYAQHPSTDVLYMAWTLDDGAVYLWHPGEPPPQQLFAALKRGDLLAAWNASFERIIWNNVLVSYGFPTLPIERFYCVAALARARGFPGKLEKVARFAGLNSSKDMEGHRLMLKLCRPRNYEADGTPIWWDDPDEYARLGAYCLQDVVVERAFFNSMLPFTDEELASYHLSERINDRGVCVDVELARAAVEGAAGEKLSSSDTLRVLTNGEITATTQVARIAEWVEREWKPLASLSKENVQDALEEDPPEHVREVLELRLEQSRAAVSKFKAMLDKQIDGVVRGLFLFRGAGQTGRYSSLGLQVHNLLRKSSPEAIPILKKHGIKGLRLLGDPVHLLAQMVRPAFVPAPGKLFLVGDYAQIEARIAAWLAGATSMLSGFREGRDVYCEFATLAYGRLITKADEFERFVGKGSILGLGFGGAIGALDRSFRKDKVILLAERLQELVDIYRKKYAPELPVYWRALDDATHLAMIQRGGIVEAGAVSYLFDGQHLWCKLPSGRFMCYPFAHFVEGKFGEAIAYRRANKAPKEGEREWPEIEMWYGLCMENLAQAIAFDLLELALHRLEARGFAVRLHIHDELVVEVDADKAEELLPEFLAVMEELPSWALGLPIKAEGSIKKRYSK